METYLVQTPASSSNQAPLISGRRPPLFPTACKVTPSPETLPLLAHQNEKSVGLEEDMKKYGELSPENDQCLQSHISPTYGSGAHVHRTDYKEKAVDDTGICLKVEGVYPEGWNGDPATFPKTFTRTQRQPTYGVWYQDLNQLDYETFASIRKRPVMIRTPPSDITEQERFDWMFRRIIFSIYFVSIPVGLLLITVMCQIFCSTVIAEWLAFMFGISWMILGVLFFPFFGFFEEAAFLSLCNRWYFFTWPLLPLILGFFGMIYGENKKDVQFSIVLVSWSLLICSANVVAWRVAKCRERERIEKWPPLEDISFIDSLLPHRSDQVDQHRRNPRDKSRNGAEHESPLCQNV